MSEAMLTVVLYLLIVLDRLSHIHISHYCTVMRRRARTAIEIDGLNKDTHHDGS